jgi:hypothetical protein
MASERSNRGSSHVQKARSLENMRGCWGSMNTAVATSTGQRAKVAPQEVKIANSVRPTATLYGVSIGKK